MSDWMTDGLIGGVPLGGTGRPEYDTFEVVEEVNQLEETRFSVYQVDAWGSYYHESSHDDRESAELKAARLSWRKTQPDQ